jgi:phage-related tail protein
MRNVPWWWDDKKLSNSQDRIAMAIVTLARAVGRLGTDTSDMDGNRDGPGPLEFIGMQMRDTIGPALEGIGDGLEKVSSAIEDVSAGMPGVPAPTPIKKNLKK